MRKLFGLALLLLAATGCRNVIPVQTQQIVVDQVVSEKDGTQIVFFLQSPSNDSQLFLQDIAVQKLDCERDCNYWSLVSDGVSGIELKRNSNSFVQIDYGESLKGMSASQLPKELGKGRFQVGGTLTISKEGEKISQLFSGIFLLDLDGNRKKMLLDD